MPREVDLRQLEEATALLTALAGFSRTRGLDFEIYYAGEVIGYVTGGNMDEGVREVFLDGWKQFLGLSRDDRKGAKE